MKSVRFIAPGSEEPEFGCVVGASIAAFSVLQKRAETSHKFLDNSRDYLAHLPESEKAARKLLEWGERHVHELADQECFAIDSVKLLAPVEVTAFPPATYRPLS